MTEYLTDPVLILILIILASSGFMFTVYYAIKLIITIVKLVKISKQEYEVKGLETPISKVIVFKDYKRRKNK